MERINQQKTEMKRRTSPESLPSVFISYSWANNDYINTVESAISRKANIYRDNKNIDSWSSINEFMKTIRKQDFALLFISDAYLKSIGCMFEVIQLMKEDHWVSKTIFVVLDDAKSIYDAANQLSYVEHWCNYHKKLSDAIIKLPPDSTAKQSEELKKVAVIKVTIGDFLNKVADSNNPPLDKVVDAITERIDAFCFGPIATADNNPIINQQKDALDLLLAASRKDGVIIATQSLSSYRISAGEICFVDSTNNRDIAHWRSLLQELEDNNYIRATNYKNEIYRVTEEGYQIADSFDNTTS